MNFLQSLRFIFIILTKKEKKQKKTCFTTYLKENKQKYMIKKKLKSSKK